MVLAYGDVVPASSPSRLPRGRHGLTRAEVETSQRERLLSAMADAMSRKGYVATSVEDVLKGAGVSRESFYRLFRSKQDCFMAAFEHAGVRLLRHVSEAAPTAGSPIERFERVCTAYLRALVSEPALARLFLIEVHAAGPEAITRRIVLQREFAEAIAALFEVRTETGRFACQTIVAATSAMLTGPMASGDLDAVLALDAPLCAHVRELWERGVLR